MQLTKNNKSGVSKGTGCLTIFGLVFLIAGLAVGFFALKNLAASLQASSWVETPAQVVSADLKVNHGDDSTTYKATGSFRYQFNGKTYTSGKLYFGFGSDNVGSFHQDLVNDMRRSQSRQQSMSAWVNPDNPSEAVLIKDVRWGLFGLMMLFPLLFGGVGAGIMWIAKRGKKKALEELELQSIYPEQPWMWRSEWHTSELLSNNKNLLWFSIGFAIFWNSISTPLLFILPHEVLDKNNYLALIGLLFPLVGIGLAAWAVRNYLQWKRFGESKLTLQELPARLGQTLRATLHIPAEIKESGECLVRVECIHKYTSGSGDNRSTREEIKWQDEQRLNINPASFNQTHDMPLVFKLPNNQPISDWSIPGSEHLWRLSAAVDLPGADYAASFEIPVFEPDDSQESGESDYEEQFFAEMLDDNANIDQGDWSRLNFTLDQNVHGRQYIFGRARLKSMCFGLSLMALIFGGVGIAMFVVENGSSFIGVGFSFFGLLLGWGALHQWLYRSAITVSHNKLISQSGWLNANTKEFTLADVKRLYKHSSMSSGNVKYYGIYIDTPDKRKIKLAENLVGNRDVDSLMHKIANEFGLDGALVY
ncbi:MAG: DUF3592 domain-containing protein [Gammaproteobacteria bacterium]|nr:DUF3592 domain-containing protein [Gammaproteobacteria bacterium]